MTEFTTVDKLKKRVDIPNGFSLREKCDVRIARNLLGAIHYLHESGIVQCDIKLDKALGVDDDTVRPVCINLAHFMFGLNLNGNRTSLNTQASMSFYPAP